MSTYFGNYGIGANQVALIHAHRHPMRVRLADPRDPILVLELVQCDIDIDILVGALRFLEIDPQQLEIERDIVDSRIVLVLSVDRVG